MSVISYHQIQYCKIQLDVLNNFTVTELPWLSFLELGRRNIKNDK